MFQVLISLLSIEFSNKTVSMGSNRPRRIYLILNDNHYDLDEISIQKSEYLMEYKAKFESSDVLFMLIIIILIEKFI